MSIGVSCSDTRIVMDRVPRSGTRIVYEDRSVTFRHRIKYGSGVTFRHQDSINGSGVTFQHHDSMLRIRVSRSDTRIV